jgi:hypothetical protein
MWGINAQATERIICHGDGRLAGGKTGGQKDASGVGENGIELSPRDVWIQPEAARGTSRQSESSGEKAARLETY